MSYTYKPTNYKYGNVTVNASALPGSGYVYTTNNTSGSWVAPTMQVNQSGKISLQGKDADVDINGVSLKETLASIQEMLGVMKIDPALEKEFEELRAAGDHYRKLREKFTEQKAVWDTLKQERFDK
jgi:hypothetical protein